MDQKRMCSRIEKAFEICGKRWTGKIVYQLSKGPQRFAAIENALPNLSGKMLTERLRELECEGIIRRDVYPEIPVRIEYSLTEKGKSLADLFAGIADWAYTWVDSPEQP